MHADKDKSKHYETLTRLLGGEMPGQQEAVNTEKAWEKLSSRMLADGLLDEKPRAVKTIRLPLWVRYAASLALLAITGSLVYISLRDKTGPELFAVNTSTENQTLVQFLQDGTVVYLAENTRLSYPERFEAKQRRVSLEGEAFFEVTGKQDQPFMIQAGPATIQVLGTAFNVKSTGQDNFELFVREGSVSVNPRTSGGRAIVAEAGEGIVFTSGRFEKFREELPAAGDWRMHRMHFKDETLENVLMVINRNLGSSLKAAPEVSQRRLTVTFYQNTVPTIIELISLSMNLEVEETQESTIVFRPKI